MFRQDFILRMIKQFVHVMVQLVRLKRAQQYQEAHEIIGQTWEELFGLPAQTLETLSERTLLAMIKNENAWNINTCLMMARLFKESGEIAEAEQQDEESFRHYLKALNVYLEVAADTTISTDMFRPTDIVLPDIEYERINPHEDIEDLIQKLAPYILPVPTLYLLFQYYEKYGHYARAEDTLFELLEHDRSSPEMAEQGILFYQRLLKKSDDRLKAGDLPRPEVEEGLAHMQKRMKVEG